MPSQSGPHHGLKFGYTTGEGGWGGDMTANMKRVDALLTLAVLTRGLNTPPGSPSGGDRHVVGSAPTGAWSGHAGEVAAYDSFTSAWQFYQPAPGWRLLVEAEGVEYFHNGDDFATAGPIYAAAFPDIQDAVDAAEAAGGGRVFVGPGTFSQSTVPAFTGLSIPGDVEVIGCGERVTVLDMTGQSASLDAVTITGEHAKLRELKIKGQGVSGSGRGIVVAPSLLQRHVVIEHVVIESTPSWGVYFGTAFDIVKPYLAHVRVLDVKSNGGFYLSPATYAASLAYCNLDTAAPGGTLVHLDGARRTMLLGCTIEPANDAVAVRISPNSTSPWTASLIGCWIEHRAATASQYMIEVSGSGQADGVRVSGCQFVRNNVDLHLRAVRLALTGGAAIAVAIEHCLMSENRTVSAFTDDVALDGAGQDEVTLIGNRVWNINDGSSRAIAVSGTNKDKLLRIADAGRVQVGRFATGSLPADAGLGEMAWDTTTAKLKVYNGAAWVNAPN